MTKQLRLLSTLLIGFAVAQAGFGSGFLDGEARALLIVHATNAFAVVVLSVISTVLGFGFRRDGGPGWVLWLPLGITVGVVLQMLVGFAGVRGGHVFLGVLVLCAVTSYCSSTWRLLPADTTRTPKPAG